MSGGCTAEASKPCCHGHEDTQSIDSELKRILRAAGIESAPIDPSSADYLRELVALEIAKKENNSKESIRETKSAVVAATTVSATCWKDEEDERSFAVARGNEEKAQLNHTLDDRKPTTPETAYMIPITPRVSKTKESESYVKKESGSNGTEVFPRTSDVVSGDETEMDNVEMEEDLSISDADASLVSVLRKELKDQKRAMKKQSKNLLVLNDHIRELTDVVHALKKSVDDLRSTQHVLSPQPSMNQISAGSSTPRWGAPDHPATPAPAAAVPANGEEAVADALRNDELRRAHQLAHNVAWRIASFPVRAILFYMKYEYRIWLVLWRLAKRDVINPIREAGRIFQLGFAFMIIYGRISPALERRKLEYSDDDYESDEDDILDDPEFQVQAISMAVLFGFLYHVGVIGLFYRFFLRDRLHVRIWKDLRAGVELTPTYGLNLDQNNNPEENEQDVGNGNNNDEGQNNAANDNNRDRPVPPNRQPQPPGRGNQEGNVADDGIVLNVANAVLHGVNDFFMGHRRRPEQRGAIGGGVAVRQEVAHADPPNGDQPIVEEEDTEHDEAVAGPGNPVFNFVSDILCLLYSFAISILPSWDFEQQLRDIRDEEDRRERARREREEEVLRNQNNSDSNSEDGKDDPSSDEGDDGSDRDDI